MYECVWLAIVLRMLICTTHCMQLANNDDNDDDEEDRGGIHKKNRSLSIVFSSSYRSQFARLHF